MVMVMVAIMVRNVQIPSIPVLNMSLCAANVFSNWQAFFVYNNIKISMIKKDFM